MPINFDPIVVVMEETKDLSQLLVDELMGFLLSPHSRMNKNNNSSLENASISQISISRGRERGSRGIGRNSNQNNARFSLDIPKRTD